MSWPVLDDLLSTSPLLQPLGIPGDLTDDSFVRSLVDQTVAKFGRLDILVNNAGMSIHTRFEDPAFMDVFENTHRLNLRSVVYLTHYAVQHLIQAKGHIINISSCAGIRPVSICSLKQSTHRRLTNFVFLVELWNCVLYIQKCTWYVHKIIVHRIGAQRCSREQC